MKLLFVIDNLGTGGAQRQMVNLALGLSQMGHTVSFFTYAPGDLLARPVHAAGMKVIHHEKSGRYSPAVIFALAKAIWQSHCDLVLSFLTTPNIYALLASRLVAHRPRVAVSERFYDPPEGVGRLERVFRQVYRLADHLVVNSNHQRINFAGKYPWLKGRLSTIYNGYDLKAFRPQRGPSEGKDLRLLTIASVSPYKNGLVIIDAMHELKEKYGIPTQMDWIGQRVLAGERLDYLHRMDARIDELGLREAWHWLDQRTDIADQLNSHDVMIHPSFGEGLPNVVCEALACGLPVILSNTLDHPYLVTNGVNGFLFDLHDPHALAEKIKTFFDLPLASRNEMGKQGRLLTERTLSMDVFVQAYAQLFTSLLGDKSERRAG